jgi:hypothetical protein
LTPPVFKVIDDAPEYRPFNVLEGVITKVAAIFKTTQYGGNIGCLLLIVGEAEMRRVERNNTLNCARATMPSLLNPKITNKTTPADNKTFNTEHNQTWYKYYLDQVVNL